MDVTVNSENNNFSVSPPKEHEPSRKAPEKVISAHMPAARLTITPDTPKPPLPPKNRSVSLPESSFPGPARSFDFRFVDGDNEVRSLLHSLNGEETGHTVLISHPDDLSENNLLNRLSISVDGRHQLLPGKLFENDEPLTLVIDIRSVSCEDLPKFNDLLDPDNPCLYDKASQTKRPPERHVALVVLADRKQLTSVGESDEVPGADFWRRVNRPGNTWQFDPQGSDETRMDVDKASTVPPATEDVMNDDDTLVINCHFHSHWRQLLFGGPGVDQQGRIRHIPGKLEQLKNGQRVVLKGADWNNLPFEQAIRQLVAQKHYESNGLPCALPDNIEFFQTPVQGEELRTLFNTMVIANAAAPVPSGKQKPIIINQATMTGWLNPIGITGEGRVAPNTSLVDQIRAGGVVTVTSPLSEARWFQLLGALQNIRETTGLQPQLQVTHAQGQPESLGLGVVGGSSHIIGDNTPFTAVTYQQSALAVRWLKDQKPAPLVIQVNEQTSLSQLFDNIHIASEKKARFGHRQSGLQAALLAGKPVVFRGLESNPTLQQLLEPLVCGQPLLVNGRLQAYPKADITLLWPEDAQSPSRLWHSVITSGERCPEADIWALSSSRHNLPRSQLPEQAIKQLYEAFKTIPADRCCQPLPEMTEGLLNNLIRAVRRAQQVDQALQPGPRHWRKAINSVLTHGTRENPSVRDFMKVVCEQLLPDAGQTHWVDPDRLNAVINSAPRQLDREFVRQNVWQLARAFGPGLLLPDGNQNKNTVSYSSFGKAKCLDRLCALIVAHVPQEQRQAVACQLGVDPIEAKQHEPLTIRSASRVKRLEDALASGWQLREKDTRTRSEIIHALAAECFGISSGVTDNEETECIRRITARLDQSLAWQGSTEAPLPSLASDLYHGSMNQKDRESRRLSRLGERLSDSPVIFLQGETGTGKSYFSAKVARDKGWGRVVSLGPSDSEQTLMKSWQWRECPEDGDRYMESQNRVLMEWATAQPAADGDYVTLVLDEANLAQTGLLASLKGLWEPEPCIYVNGHPVKVSPQHRVILTGNPDHYAGRQLDPALEALLPKAYYPSLNQAFLRDRVVEPALARQLQRHIPEQQAEAIARLATGSVMALWQYYPELLPEHEFTPRDLTDICGWVGWYLDRALSDTAAGGPVTSEQMNGLILQSFRDVLNPEISGARQGAETALESWFSARYPVDSTLSDRVHNQALTNIRQTFIKVTGQAKPEFDTSGSAVSELVRQLGQDLSRCQQAYHRDRKHGGRQATLVEGPAGRGKDVTLNLLINSFRRQVEEQKQTMPPVHHLNGCDCSWDTLRNAIRQAKVHGGIVVVSEMNLIDSQHLEGELNDILAGDAHPGFHLFATTNPPEYSGRKPLSPALKGRFRYLPIRQYSPAELQAIAESVLPETAEGKSAAECLTRWHCRLRACLQGKNRPLQPSSLDLQNVARAVVKSGDFTETALGQCIRQHYRLYLMAAETSLEQLPELAGTEPGKVEVDRDLCDWLNQTVTDLDRPWSIQRSDCNDINTERHKIRIKASLSDSEARTEAIKMLAQAQWQASGLSLKPNDTDDRLVQAIYRNWQQYWFDQRFGRTGVRANTVFALTKEQQLVLEMPENTPYLEAADRKLREGDFNKTHLWPAYWREIHKVTLTPLRRGEANEGAGAEAIPITFMDRKTDYDCQKMPELSARRIFNNGIDPRMYRLEVLDIRMDCHGNLGKVPFVKGEYGLETVIPYELPEGEVALDTGQSLGAVELRKAKEWQRLPGLHSNEKIPALRVTPAIPYRLRKDRLTGQHWICFPDAIDGQPFRVDYLVENREVPQPHSMLSPCDTSAVSTRTDCTIPESMKSELYDFFSNFETSDIPPMQKKLIRRIKSARTQENRIAAITEYCSDFKGDSRPESDENLFGFLLRKRQGSCRHRAFVFVAICRYFGIPSRLVDSEIHVYSEYSLNGGVGWESMDLGGAPAHVRQIGTKFQPSDKSKSGSSTETRRIAELLKGADPKQLQSLAKACDLSLEELHKALEAGRALPETCELVQKLWKQKDLTGLSLGGSLLEARTELSPEEKQLIGTVDKGKYELLFEAVKEILSNSDEDQVTVELRKLHSRMVIQGKESSLEWLSTIMNVLNGVELTRPSVIHFANEALQAGWLDPLPDVYNYSDKALEQHNLLVRLQSVDELRTQADSCLQKWYRTLLSPENNSQHWQRFYQEQKQKQRGDHFIVTHNHGGKSSFLETRITSSSLQNSWTDQPESIPNVERMLVRQPAFPRFISGKASHRPVIIAGCLNWRDTKFNKKYEELFQEKVRNSPELKRLEEKNKNSKLTPEEKKIFDGSKKQCRDALKQAFSHYLYQMTHAKGSRLTCCWSILTPDTGSDEPYSFYGTHEPSSPEELYNLLSNLIYIRDGLKATYLRQAHNASNALVLNSEELITIAEEFLNTVDLDSFDLR
ncbi:AAA family ATPase [Endozoicomonas euniceicola]|uniref:AAA family ATPase n=1 Tax=Endozoicomonas euniceicola TaxID=1234143 RepID=A0ABY6GZQ5_9GAMM|nr:AAA family ATPase [Endozoicomonas euniceicola]UYM18047.1 AAA family ATPase [Endozoicomonas euniceicola]